MEGSVGVDDHTGDKVLAHNDLAVTQGVDAIAGTDNRKPATGDLHTAIQGDECRHLAVGFPAETRVNVIKA